MSRVLRTWVLPVVGLSFFWGFFRFQSFFGALYPLASNGSATPFSPYALYLISLAVFSVLVLAAEHSFRERFGQNPTSSVKIALIAASTVLGATGTYLCQLSQSNCLPGWVIWVSTPPVAIGFCAQYLAWASYCSRSFSCHTILAMAGSFFISLAAVVGVSRISTDWNSAIVLLTPVISGLCLIALNTGSPSAPASAEPMGHRTHSSFLTELKLLVKDLPFHAVLFVAFLLCGAVIRGIVDMGDQSTQGIRWPLSVALSALMFGACIALYVRLGKKAAGPDRLAEKFVFVTWLAMAALFSGGVVWSIAAGSSGTAGHLVVVARSILDFVLLILMCDVATRWEGRRSTVFIALGMVTEVLSWALSYIAVPALLGLDVPEGHSVQDALELGALLALLLFMVAAFGAMGTFGRDNRPAPQPAPQQVEDGPAAPLPAESDESPLFDEIAAAYHLTPREAQVIELFSQGHSVKHVAETLVISMGTAQSHLKGAYRKLDIHSRDELLELVHSFGEK